MSIGVLRPCCTTEWAAKIFIITNKYGWMCWIGDFSSLKKVLKRRVHPFPVVHDAKQNRRGYAFFTKLDLNIFYYTLELEVYNKNLMTIVSSIVTFQYLWTSLVLKTAPVVSQSIIEDIFSGLNVETCLNHIGIFIKTYEGCIKEIKEVLRWLGQAWLKADPLKCEWEVKETYFIGNWLTPNVIKPWSKNFHTVINMSPPTNFTQLWSFLGAVR